VSTLAPVRPPQELLDGLSVDAAWERAKDLEAEIRRLRLLLKSGKEAFEQQYAKRTRMEKGIRRIMDEYPVTGGLRNDLLSLLLGD
jgi:hypothetical protein